MTKPRIFPLVLFALAGCGGNSSGHDSMPSVVQYPSSPRVHLGDPAQFTLVAKGKNLAYQWWHKGERIPGATFPTYRIASVAAEDFGDYTVDITRGDTTWGVFTELVEIGAPTIVSESTGEPIDGTITLSVIVEADPAPSYQWVRQVGSALPTKIPGATGPTLSVPVPATGGALYWVDVWNAKGGAMGSPNSIYAP